MCDYANKEKENMTTYNYNLLSLGVTNNYIHMRFNIIIIPYKMKSWRGIYFGGLAIWENLPNLIPPIIIFNA